MANLHRIFLQKQANLRKKHIKKPKSWERKVSCTECLTWILTNSASHVNVSKNKGQSNVKNNSEPE